MKKYFDFLIHLSDYNDFFLITGGFALYLHSLEKKISLNREVSDLDIYTFKKLPIIDQNNYFDEYSIYNNKIQDLFENNVDFYLDIFSKGYLLDTVKPLKSDLKTIKINSKKYYISSIEHIFMLKLLTTYTFRNKEYKDLVFILKNFKLNKKICSLYLNETKYKKLNLDLSSINNIDQFLNKIENKIKKEYSYLPIKLNEIEYKFLVTLLNYEHIIFDSEIFEKFNPIFTNLNEHYKEILKLGIIYLFFNITKKVNHLKLFSEVFNSINSFNFTEKNITIYLTRCRYINNLLLKNINFDNLLKEKRFLKNYFKLIS